MKSPYWLTQWEGKTFDDCLIRNGRNLVESRESVDLRTRVSRNLWINIPLISANMLDTTESEMAIAFARIGGLGVIHKDWPTDYQCREVVKVKRAQNSKIDKPRTIVLSEKIGVAIEVMKKEKLGGLLVTRKNGRLVGILTTRDILFCDSSEDPVSKYMTPRAQLVWGKPETTISEAEKVFREYRIEKLPLVDDSFKVVGLITLRDIFNLKKYPLISLDSDGQLLVGAAIGATGDYIERAQELLKAGADLIVMDIKSGYSEIGVNAVKELRRIVGRFELMVGNVVTSEAVDEFTRLGVEAIKIGYGPGGACTSRLITGNGVSQLDAILECYWNQRFKYNRDLNDFYSVPPLCADGGVRNSGHVVKALCAGASSIMLGTYVAGTIETPGPVFPEEVVVEGRLVKTSLYKEYRGEASADLVAERLERSGQEVSVGRILSRTPEGIRKRVPFSGDSVYDILSLMIGGLKSGISDAGYCSIGEMRKTFDPGSQFTILSQAAREESKLA